MSTEDWTPPFPGYFLYYPHRKYSSAAAAAMPAIRNVPIVELIAQQSPVRDRKRSLEIKGLTQFDGH